MKRVLSMLAAFLMLSATGSAAVSAAVIPDSGIVSPCYDYTNSITSTLSIDNGSASCVTTIYGISGTTTKIVVTQYLEKKNGNSWDEVNSETDTFDSWWCNDTNSFTITESGTYRLRSKAVVYSGSKSEVVKNTSKEKTVTV